MTGSINNNLFFRLTGQVKSSDALKNIDFTKSDYTNIFTHAQKNSTDGTVTVNDFLNETKDYGRFGEEDFINNLEQLEDLSSALEEIDMFDGVEGLSYQDLAALNNHTYNNSAVTKGNGDAVSRVPFESRVQAAQTARADRASNSTNVKPVDTASLENKDLSTLKSDRTSEIQNLNEARHRAQDYEKNNSEVVSAQASVDEKQAALDEAIQTESENSESEEVQALKEQLDATEESITTQQEVVDGIQTQLDEADNAVTECQDAVTTAEQGVTDAESKSKVQMKA